MSKYIIRELEEEFETYDDAVEFIHQEEIIYYNRAIKYLAENDSSLNDLGCTLEKWNMLKELLQLVRLKKFKLVEM